MLSVKKQLFICLMFAILTLVTIVLVMENFNGDEAEPPVHRSKKGRSLEVVFLVFFATLISTSRPSLLFLVDRFFKRTLSPFVLGLVNVFVKVTCLALFDFRIIHVTGNSHAIRMAILFADVSSFFFEEAQRSFQEKTQTSLDKE